MRSRKLALKRVQLVQNQWDTHGRFVHRLHRRMLDTAQLGATFPTFYHSLTHERAQTVHNISAALTDIGARFSSEYTGPITTTTTFIYKRIEKEAF